MEDTFSLKSRFEQDCLIIEASGYLNRLGGETISAECDRHLANGITVIIDMKQTRMVNSIGISILLEIIEKLNELGGRLVFAHLDPTIEKTFTIMGLFHYATRYASTRQALNDIGRGT